MCLMVRRMHHIPFYALKASIEEAQRITDSIPTGDTPSQGPMGGASFQTSFTERIRRTNGSKLTP